MTSNDAGEGQSPPPSAANEAAFDKLMSALAAARMKLPDAEGDALAKAIVRYGMEMEALAYPAPASGARPPFSLADFVTESNRIEGLGPAQLHEIEAHEVLLALPCVTVPALQEFVQRIAGAPLRSQPGMNVRVGNHLPPPGGPEIPIRLARLLDVPHVPAFDRHVFYEALHPFMDGNGRSGRALWLHDMGGIEGAPLGFLHHWYYQSLNGGRRNA